MRARLLVDLVLLIGQRRVPEQLLNDVEFAAHLAAALDLLVRKLLGLRELAEVDKMALLSHDIHVVRHLFGQQ